MKSIKETMQALGFQYLKTKIDGEQARVYRIEEDKYKELMNKLIDEDDEEIDEADPIEEDEM